MAPRAALAAFLLAAAPWGFGSPAAAVAQAAEAPSQEALELANIALPLDDFIDRDVRAMEQFFVTLPASDADAKALEDEFPGAYRDIWKSIEEEFRVIAAKEHPKLLTRLAALYQRHLTRDEMAALRAFFLTDAGQRALAAAHQADQSAIMKEIIADPEAPVSADAVATVQQEAIANAVGAFTPADMEATRRLAEAVPFAKILTLQSGAQALILEYLNEPDPEMEAEMEKLIAGAMDRYFDGKIAEEP